MPIGALASTDAPRMSFALAAHDDGALNAGANRLLPRWRVGRGGVGHRCGDRQLRQRFILGRAFAGGRCPSADKTLSSILDLVEGEARGVLTVIADGQRSTAHQPDPG